MKSVNPWFFCFWQDVPTNSTGDIVESYYLKTPEGLFFAVKGMEHPEDRVIAVVRYAPDPDGERKKDGLRYRRLYHFAEQEQLLQSSYPQYRAYDPIFKSTLQSVPKSQIRCVYDPRARLRELSGNFSAGGVEADAVAFTALIQREAGIKRSAIGVTGSLLIGLHVDASDLDISVFGVRNCERVYETLASLRGLPSDVRPLDPKGIEELYRQRGSGTQMPFEEFAAIECKRICQGLFRRRPYFIRFIKNMPEAGVKYGWLRYTPVGSATITAVVSASQDAIYTPCRYLVSDVCTVEGPRALISEVVSFRGRFCELARAGDYVLASGTLERFDSVSGHTGYRLLLGNSPSDAMKVCASNTGSG
jgi:predicted nucleotidyltransferase